MGQTRKRETERAASAALGHRSPPFGSEGGREQHRRVSEREDGALERTSTRLRPRCCRQRAERRVEKRALAQPPGVFPHLRQGHQGSLRRAASEGCAPEGVRAVLHPWTLLMQRGCSRCSEYAALASPPAAASPLAAAKTAVLAARRGSARCWLRRAAHPLLVIGAARPAARTRRSLTVHAHGFLLRATGTLGERVCMRQHHARAVP